MRTSKTFATKSLLSRRFISPLTSLSTSTKELNGGYARRLQLTLIAILLVTIGLFHILPKKFLLASETTDIESIDLIAEELPPPTKQPTLPPPPIRPAVPIPTDDDDIPEDLTIAESELDFDELPPPPPLPPDDSVDDGYVFVAYDSPPEPVGGYASLQKNLKYPELARLSGMEGKVIVGVLIDTEGNSVKTTILKDSGGRVGFEKAAQEAVMKLKWIPAKQRDKPVKVWASVSVTFQLAGV
jgi:protein TonB